MSDGECQVMVLVGLRRMGNPLCYNPGQKAGQEIACLVFSALEKQGTVLPPWGRSVASLSWANKCPVVCVIAARLKGKKRANQHLTWKADLRGVSILLGKAILQQKGWSGAAPEPALSPFC